MKTKNLAAVDASKSIFATAVCRHLRPFSKTTPFADISFGIARNEMDGNRIIFVAVEQLSEAIAQL